MADDLEPFHEIADEEEEMAQAPKIALPDVNDVDMLDMRDETTAELAAGSEALETSGEAAAKSGSGATTPSLEIMMTAMCMILNATPAELAEKIDGGCPDECETTVDSQEEITGYVQSENSVESNPEEESENPENFADKSEEEFEDLENFLNNIDEEFEDLENFLDNIDEEFEELEQYLESYVPDSNEDNFIEYLDKSDIMMESENHEVYSSDIEIKKSKNKVAKNPEIGIRKYVEVYSLGSENTPDAQRNSQATKGAKMKLRQGITMDSGSHHNVLPRRLVKASRIRQSAFSKRGVHYIAANKGKIANEGETSFEFETTDGDPERWDFQIAEVNKALGSIADRVDNNNRVAFDKDMLKDRDVGYIFNKTSRRMIKMVREGNVWKVEALVDAENVHDAGFAGRG